MKINFGCGRRVMDGFFNIDAIRHEQAPRDAELIHAIRFDADGAVSNPLPLDDGCADEVHALHVIEHVHAWEAPHLLAEWRRLLKPGGRLILELPSIELAARNLLAGMPDQMNMWPFYGDPGPKCPFNCHRWGYTAKSIKALVAAGGFVNIVQPPPVTHGARVNRDMRLEAVKA